MKYKDFLEYLENNLTGYQTFKRKARQYQAELNARRKKDNRWTEERIGRAVNEMWKKSMEGLYNKIKGEVKSDSDTAWTNFIEKNNILETVNESISEMDFSDDVA